MFAPKSEDTQTTISGESGCRGFRMRSESQPPFGFLAVIGSDSSLGLLRVIRELDVGLSIARLCQHRHST